MDKIHIMRTAKVRHEGHILIAQYDYVDGAVLLGTVTSEQGILEIELTPAEREMITADIAQDIDARLL